MFIQTEAIPDSDLIETSSNHRSILKLETVPLKGRQKAPSFQNDKFCKIRPKFLLIMHFSQESYEFVRKAQILQVCYHVEQESDNVFAKFASISRKFLQKMRCVISTKNSIMVTSFGYLNDPGSIKDAFRMFFTALPEAACKWDFRLRLWVRLS